MQRICFVFAAVFSLTFLSIAHAQQSVPDSSARPLDFRQVTTHPDIDLSPRVSPDGKWMAYVSRQTYNFDIWLAGTKGGRSTQITFHKADDYYPTWYPNSKAIVFVSQRSDAAGDIWRLKLREVKGQLLPKGEPERITDFLGFDGYPTVSPDGKKIAWVSDRSGREEIWFHNDNTGKTNQLTYLGGTHPAWSSNLQLIAFTSFRAGAENNGDIWLINLKGPKPVAAEDTTFWDKREPPLYHVTKGPTIDGFPSWTSGAKQIVFLRNALDTNGDGLLTPADKAAVWIADVLPAPVDTVKQSDPLNALLSQSFNLHIAPNAMPLTSGAENCMQPWAGADGRVYFTSDRGRNLDIWSLPADGHIPHLSQAEGQLRFADRTYSLPLHMTRQTLGPLFLDWDSKSLAQAEQTNLWDRALALQRVLDFHGAASSWAAQALYEMGICYRLLGFPAVAQSSFDLLLRSYPQARRECVYAEMASLGLRVPANAPAKEKVKFVRPELESIIQQYGDQEEAAASGQIVIGDLFFQAGDEARSFSEYAKVIKNFPARRDACAESQLKIGDVFQHYASQDEVVAAYLAVVQNYPDQRQWVVPARNRILDLLTKDLNGQAALIARYREIVGQYASFALLSAAAQQRIGDLLFQSGDFREALREYEAVETLFQGLIDEVFSARMAQSKCLLRMGESLRAFALLEKLMAELNSARPDLSQEARDALLDALLFSGDELKAQQDYELALTWYSRARAMDARSIHAHRGCIECLYYMRRIDQAITDYEQLAAKSPKDNIIVYSLGLAYSYKGTVHAELDGDPDGLDPNYLNRSSATIARALSYDYTLVQAYLTISYNYEMMENYQARLAAKPKKFFTRAFQTITAPIVSLYHTLTFYEERKPARYYERAIHELTKAIVLNDETKDPGLEASLALNLANNYYNLREFGFEKAYEYYHLKLKYDSTFTDKHREALIYERMGHCALVTEDLENGPKYLLRAIELYRQMNNEAHVQLNTKRLALLYEIGNRNDLAVDYYQEAAKYEKRNDLQADLMRSYRSIAYNYLQLSETKEAISYANQALTLLESGKIKEVKEEASRLKIGFLGLYFPVPFFNFASMGSAAASGFTTRDEKALIYSIIGTSFAEDKDYADAIHNLDEKLKIYHKRKDYAAEASFYNNLGYLYFLRGDYPAAWLNFSQSLKICTEQLLFFGSINNSLNLGQLVVLLDVGRYNPGTVSVNVDSLLPIYHRFAAQQLNKALALAEQDPIRFAKSRVHLLLLLAELSLIDPARNDYQDLSSGIASSVQYFDRASYARIYLEEALRLSLQNRLSPEECAINFELGKLYLSLADKEASLEKFNRCRKLALRHGFFDLLWRVDQSLGDLVRGMDRNSKVQFGIQRDALEYYLEAIDFLEAHSSKADGPVNLKMREDHQGLYRRAIAYLAEKGDYLGALGFAERMRAKLYLDLISGEDIVLRKERHKLYYGNAKFLQGKIDELSIELLRARNQADIAAAQVVAWRKELISYRKEYDQLLAKVRQEVPELENLVRVNPVSYRQVQSRLREDEAIAYYILTHDSTFVWLISRSQVTMTSLSISRNEARRQLTKLSQALQNGTISAELFSPLQPLLAPVRTLAPLKNLVIIPDQELLLFPWSILAAYSDWPSARVPAVVVSSSLTNHFYAFQSRKLQGEKMYMADAATFQAAIGEKGYQVSAPIATGQIENSFPAQEPALSTSDLIHLNVQSETNETDPTRSRFGFRVAKSVPAIVTPNDFYQLSLAANLISIGSDKPWLSPGSNASILAWENAFLYSGVPSILLSLWNADEQSDRTFFLSFYEKLRSMPAGAALEATKNDLRSQGKSAIEWGRFQLYGFGGMTSEEEQQCATEGFEGQVRFGHSAFDLGEWTDAIQYYEQAYQMAQRQDDQKSMSLLKQRILESAVNGGLWTKAIEYQQALIQDAEQNNDVSALASGYNNLAFFFTQNRQFGEGVAYKEKYAALAKRYGLQEEEAKSLRETGLIYERGGNYRQAVDIFLQAKDSFQAINSSTGVAQCYRDIGRIYFAYLDDYPSAMEYQRLALPLFEAQGSSADLVDALQNLGLTQEKMANYKQALEFQQRAYKIAGNLGDERLIGLSHQHLANVLWKMGDFQIALTHQNQAMEAFAKSGEEKLLQVALSTRGLIALSLGQSSQALDYQTQALDLAIQRDDKADQATIQKNIGMIYRSQGKDDLALAGFEQAAVIDSIIASKRGLAYDFRNIASIYLEQHKAPQTRHYIRQALAQSREIGDQRNEVQSLLVLGSLEVMEENADSASIHLQTVAQVAAKLYMPDIEWRAHKKLAEISAAQKRTTEAIGHYYDAVRVIESLRSRIKVEEYASGFIDDKLDVYGALVALLVEDGRSEEALQAVERGKSRSFLDMLGNRKTDFGSRGNAELITMGDSLQSRLNEAESELLHLTAPSEENSQSHKKKLEAKVTELRRAYSEYMVKMRATNPELSAMVTVDPWPIPKIQQMLPDSVAMLEYYTHAGELYLWYLTRQNVQVYRQTLDEEQLDQDVFALRKALERQLSITELSRKLYDILLKPCQAQLKSARHLIFVPHARLHYLPFAVLLDNDGQYLAMKHSLSIAPSATVLGFCLEKGEAFLGQDKRNFGVLAFGNPDLSDNKLALPFAAKEIESLTRYYPNVSSALEENATETRLREQGSYPPLMLFSCHGVFDDANPLFSALLLAPDKKNDGRLEAHEIFSLNLHAYMVAMSACETGLGTIRGGDEVIGLSRSFIYAGVSSLMSSLWKVDDLATAVLIKRFFRNLAEGMSRAEALRQAQMVVYNEINPYPAFWAAFTITGDFR
jgi:CHAT domain-containing protein/Tol biopolymer transport system component